jgi:hypothetical protein
MLLDIGANMNLYNKIGYTSFSCACMAGEASIVTYMISLGADVNGGSSRPLHLTCKGSPGKLTYRCVCVCSTGCRLCLVCCWVRFCCCWQHAIVRVLLFCIAQVFLASGMLLAPGSTTAVVPRRTRAFCL